MSDVYDLFTASYKPKNNKPLINLRARDKDGNRKDFFIDNFKPYFYVPDENGKFLSIQGKKYKKIELNMPGDVKTWRENFPDNYESDIPFPHRFCIDHGIKCGFVIENGEFKGAPHNNVKPRVLFIDIEVEAFKGVPDPKVAISPIYLIGCYDSYTQELKQFIPNNLTWNEQARNLREFLAYFKERDFDLIVGWNVYFDVAYILNRALKLNVDYFGAFGKVVVGDTWIDLAKCEMFDLQSAYRKFFQQQKFDSYSLEAIFEKEFDRPLFKYDYNTTTFEQLDVVKAANVDHVYAINAINTKWNLIGIFDEIRRLTGCNYRQSLTTIYFTDSAILHRAHGKYILPTRIGKEDKYEFEGAIVTQPPIGKFRNVVVLDFKKMYPSMIIGFNMSPETFADKPVENSFEIDGVWFKREPKGMVPEMLIEFIDKRNEVKHSMKSMDPKSREYETAYAYQYALKQIVDAVYGLMSQKAFRLYTPQISKSTTFMGRYCARMAIAKVESSGYRVIYVDTDSVMFEAGEDWKPVGYGMEKLVNEDLAKFVQESGAYYPIEVDFELAYKMIFFKLKSGKKKKEVEAAKKRYAALVMYEGDQDVDYIKVRGLEFRRSDSAKFTRMVQFELLKMILGDEDDAAIKKYILAKLEEFKKLPLDEIGIPRRMNMAMSSYKNIATVRDAWYSINYLGLNIEPGQRFYDFMVKRIHLPLPQRIELNKKWYDVDRVACVDKLPDASVVEVDYLMQMKKVVEDKLKPVLESAGVEWAWITEGHKGTTLGEWGA